MTVFLTTLERQRKVLPRRTFGLGNDDPNDACVEQWGEDQMYFLEHRDAERYVRDYVPGEQPDGLVLPEGVRQVEVRWMSFSQHFVAPLIPGGIRLGWEQYDASKRSGLQPLTPGDARRGQGQGDASKGPDNPLRRGGLNFVPLYEFLAQDHSRGAEATLHVDEDATRDRAAQHGR